MRKIPPWRHAGEGLRKRENGGKCLPFEYIWTSTEPRLTAPKTAPLCRLSASTQLRTLKGMQIPRKTILAGLQEVRNTK